MLFELRRKQRESRLGEEAGRGVPHRLIQDRYRCADLLQALQQDQELDITLDELLGQVLLDVFTESFKKVTLPVRWQLFHRYPKKMKFNS